MSHQIDQNTNAFYYAKKIIDQHSQSSVPSDQQIVYAARNLATKLILEDTTLTKHPTLFSIKNLVAISNFPLVTAKAKSEALFELGNLYTTTKKLDEAISSYKQAHDETQSDEMKKNILFRLAIIYFNLKDYRKFIPAASQLLESSTVLGNEMTSQLQIKLGLSNLELQKTDQAKSAFEQVLLIPNVSAEIETRTHFHLAEIYQANQQLDQAKTKYQLILSLSLIHISEPTRPRLIS